MPLSPGLRESPSRSASLLLCLYRRRTSLTSTPRAAPALSSPCSTREAGYGPWWPGEGRLWCTGRVRHATRWLSLLQRCRALPNISSPQDVLPPALVLQQCLLAHCLTLMIPGLSELQLETFVLGFSIWVLAPELKGFLAPFSNLGAGSC